MCVTGVSFETDILEYLFCIFELFFSLYFRISFDLNSVGARRFLPPFDVSHAVKGRHRSSNDSQAAVKEEKQSF